MNYYKIAIINEETEDFNKILGIKSPCYVQEVSEDAALTKIYEYVLNIENNLSNGDIKFVNKNYFDVVENLKDNDKFKKHTVHCGNGIWISK